MVDVVHKLRSKKASRDYCGGFLCVRVVRLMSVSYACRIFVNFGFCSFTRVFEMKDCNP